MEGKINVMSMSAGEATTDVFDEGRYGVAPAFTEEASKEASLPVEVMIVTPTTKGTYPVLLFCHGFMMRNHWYSNMFDHIVSHGYILVAPQFYTLPPISICEEIQRAIGVTNWLWTGLLSALQKHHHDNIEPDFENNLVVSGHSRGGKVAFALALGKDCEKAPPQPQKFKAVVGIDPVAGLSRTIRFDPKILNFKTGSFDMSIPVAVVGTGLGDQPKWLIPYLLKIPPFAPDGVSHAEFFNESKPPVCYFVAEEFGHLDMMDDDDDWLNLIRSFLVNGDTSKRYLMRKAVGGVVVAFLRAYLGGQESKDLDAIVDHPTLAPIKLDPVRQDVN